MRGAYRQRTHIAMTTIYKILTRTEWQTAQAHGRYTGSDDDRRDGFIHFSTAEQVPGTADKFFAGRDDLLVAAVPVAALGDALKWEPSRGGHLFPHLYAPLEIASVCWVRDMPLGPEGRHTIPVPPADADTVDPDRRGSDGGGA